VCSQSIPSPPPSELDKYSPSLETAFKIAQVFGVPLEVVFQYAGKRK
jgi:putative transcriptional regulator